MTVRLAPLPYDAMGAPRHRAAGARLPIGVTPTRCGAEVAGWELAGPGEPVTCGLCAAPGPRPDAPGSSPGPDRAGGDGITPTPAQKGQRTKRARRAATGFRVGERVRTNTPRSPRFHDRVGTVADLNLGEVGLTFTKGDDRVAAWFLPAELTRCEC